MLSENSALPKTFHPTDELAAQWKWIEPERDLSQTQISSAQDIISQAGIAGQVYLRIISLPGISKLPQDIHANKAIWAGCLFRGMVTLLMGQDAAGLLSDAVLGHPPDLGLVHPRLPPAAELMDAFVGARDGPRESES